MPCSTFQINGNRPGSIPADTPDTNHTVSPWPMTSAAISTDGANRITRVNVFNTLSGIDESSVWPWRMQREK